MLRSASSLLALAALCLQVALAKIETGTYLIQDFEGNFLGVGPVHPIYPPPDVPARLLPPSVYAQRWLVRQNDDNTLTISVGKGYPDDYKLVSRDDVVFVSAQKDPEPWSVTSVGDNKVEIKSPYEDSVFTAEPYHREEQVRLRPARGLPNQKWNFIRVDRENIYHRGSRNRFCKQEQW
ncbi:hypothetical protein BG003_006161 [Podila horticola]|nr:hypothetical protein BG003_006161 [Podila horticola]